jgi:hypothetical protein
MNKKVVKIRLKRTGKSVEVCAMGLTARGTPFIVERVVVPAETLKDSGVAEAVARVASNKPE